MAKQKSPWSSLSIHPLSGGLDVRSRPADIAAGAFRWRLNVAQSDNGQPCMDQGFTRIYRGSTNPPFLNQDHHTRNGTREPITMLFRSTDSTGRRRLFDASRSTVSLLRDLSTDINPGDWTAIMTGQGVNHMAGTTIEPPMCRAASLVDTVLFTNDNDEPQLYDLGTHAIGTIPELHTTLVLKSAKFVWSWGGFYFLANTVEGGGYTRQSSRIRWCDINSPQAWDPGTPGTMAGMQDLPYGEEIMGGGPLLNGFYIFTRSSIYVMAVTEPVAPSTLPGFSFTRAYTEPENQSGCLAYPNTLVSVGTEFWYMSRDGIYRWSPFMAEPVREDWAHKASGIFYKMPAYAFSGSPPLAPIGWYVPASRTLSFSWPAPGEDANNVTLSLRLDHKVAWIGDYGATAATSIRFNPETGVFDTENANVLIASGEDWCIKELGGSDTTVFYREYADLVGGDPANDLPLAETYHNDGYYRVLRGLFPTGMPNKEKDIRSLTIQHDTSIQQPPCIVRLRVGDSYALQDPNDVDDVCAPRWTNYIDRPLACADPMGIAEMKAKGLRESAPALEYHFLSRGNYLYFELAVANEDGSPAIGADACISEISFEARLVGT